MAATVDRLRRLIQAIVGLGLGGMAVELALLGHYDGSLQTVPFAILAVSMAALIWHMVSRRHAAARAFQFAMALMMAAGALGVILHYRGSAEFQRESDPSLAGAALFRKVMVVKSPPALAPATMALIGLFGLASIYKLEDL